MNEATIALLKYQHSSLSSGTDNLQCSEKENARNSDPSSHRHLQLPDLESVLALICIDQSISYHTEGIGTSRRQRSRTMSEITKAIDTSKRLLGHSSPVKITGCQFMLKSRPHIKPKAKQKAALHNARATSIILVIRSKGSRIPIPTQKMRR